jgi:hypothetical protein
MWDPIEFYDDLEHSIFKWLTCGTLENFMTTWNTLFLKCGTQLNFMMTCNTLFLK